jgi:microcompartment protein CcmL/EutN
MAAKAPYQSDVTPLRPAIGLLESNSIAKGIEFTDAMMKEAPIRVLYSRTICPGKYICLITGEVEEVRSSIRRGKEVGQDAVIDELIIPNIHPQVVPAISGTTGDIDLDALGIIECFSVASLIVAADAAAKRANVNLLEVRLAMAIGGKAFVTMTGVVSAVRTAVAAGAGTARKIGMLVREVVIPQPDKQLLEFLV